MALAPSSLFLIALLALIFDIPPKVEAVAKWAYAVDVWTAVSQKNFKCMYDAGYSTAFIRIYTPSEGGKRDSNGKSNVVNALAANLAVEVFVQPAPPPSTSKKGAKQFDEAYNYMSESSISAGSIWLMVTQPSAWSTNPADNIAFINSFLDRARSNNLHVGIYTNWYDWYLITNAYKDVEKNGAVMLWYWHVLGIGQGAETTQGYSDFRAFGSWSGDPAIKQFGIIESVCGVTLNRDTYLSANDENTSSDSDTRAASLVRGVENRRLAMEMMPNDIGVNSTTTAFANKSGAVHKDGRLFVGGAVFAQLSGVKHSKTSSTAMQHLADAGPKGNQTSNGSSTAVLYGY